MKAITLWQPWASLFACGVKKFETRSWATRHRGEIAIHSAAKKVKPLLKRDEELLTAVMRAFSREGITDIEVLPCGYILATGNLTKCYKMLAYPEKKKNGDGYEVYVADMDCADLPFGMFIDVSEEELLFGDWRPGRFAWAISDRQLLEEPIKAKGQQGLWNCRIDVA